MIHEKRLAIFFGSNDKTNHMFKDNIYYYKKYNCILNLFRNGRIKLY